MIAIICDGLAGLGQIFWAAAVALVMAAALLGALGLWFGIVWFVSAAFKNWRLYSPHPLAKRIRKHLRARREAARA